MPRQYLPASQFSIQTLTDAYNQTRVDYLVPMPLNAARLQEYIHIYDIDMDRSVVALDGDQILGINMLGVRAGVSWITRLGVLPVKRRSGTGSGMMDFLLARSAELTHPLIILEVIKNNTPAHELFKKCAFKETRELLILRRPPNGQLTSTPGDYTWLSQSDAVATLRTYPGPLPWTNQPETFENTGDTLGLACRLPDGDQGWVVFRKQKFYLTHFVLHTQNGDPQKVAYALLNYIHSEFAYMDTHTENIAYNDPHLPAFWALGYLEVFRRIEMYRYAA